MTTHYEPVEGERLEFEPEIYGTDDTTQIFGDDSRIPIGLREILVDPRLKPSKRFFCCGAVTSLLVILSVVFLFIIGGYFHVQSEIKERKLVARNGLSLVPELSSDGGWIVFINLRTDSDNYAKEISKHLKEYTVEQDSRQNCTRECKPEDRPDGRKWCRFPTKKFIRAGKGCTADDNYGYDSRKPCILLVLKDRIGWEPQFNNKSTSRNDIPLKCSILDTFRLYDEHINVSYYPAHDLNANYGAFSLNKLPSKPLKDEKGEETCGGEDGETLDDQPTLAFVKFFLPEAFQHGVVRCTLISSLAGAEIENLASFKGTTELRFDIVA